MNPSSEPNKPITCLVRQQFSTQKLVTNYPPKMRSKNKLAVYQRVKSAIGSASSSLTVSRWSTAIIPNELIVLSSLQCRDDLFDYEPCASSHNAIEWHMNFANYDLFCAYGGDALAQDELQVLEHPVLGSLREAILAHRDSVLCTYTSEQSQPTPILITGVERLAHLNTDPDVEENRPMGLYGWQFAKAKTEVVLNSLRSFNPPTISNIVAIEAPTGGVGRYTAEQISYALTTAYSGFAAIKAETQYIKAGAQTILHTGHWGAGVYGGDRTLMALVQWLAASLANVEHVVFHAFDSTGVEEAKKAESILRNLTAQRPILCVSDIIKHVSSMGFTWGQGDGNLR